MTGGAGGLGSATAERFLNDGASVAIVDLNREAAEALLANEFKRCDRLARWEGDVVCNLLSGVRYGERARFYRADVSIRQECFDLVDKIVADMGKVNFLYNAVAFFKSSVR